MRCPFFGQLIEMAFSIGDSVACNADKVKGNYPAKQRYKIMVLLCREADIIIAELMR